MTKLDGSYAGSPRSKKPLAFFDSPLVRICAPYSLLWWKLQNCTGQNPESAADERNDAERGRGSIPDPAMSASDFEVVMEHSAVNV